MDTLHSVNNNLSVKVILLMTVNVRFPVHLAQSLPRFCHLTLKAKPRCTCVFITCYFRIYFLYEDLFNLRIIS